jgi:hypothetical protein
MNNDKKQQEQTGEQNPTLDTPGSQVADYGNSTGGSATDVGQTKEDNDPSANTDRSRPGEETIGTP